ncbi:MAG: DUF2330 domain-containing protein [Minicystis sp.]
MRSRSLLALVLLFVLLWPTRGAAFCGFYVSGAGGSLINDATQVVLMRGGLRTVLSMQNDYHGPPESFALVIPVPVVLQKENVRTLPRHLFDRVEKLDGPRLVEYWEQDPCMVEPDVEGDKEGGTGTRAKGEEGSMGNAFKKPLVKVEAEFSVDEYEIVILSALDAVALDTWLRENGYRIPEGADRYLRPYVQGGSKFFVAKVDPRKIKFTWGRATLSPLRFFYDTESFSLPVRLGLMNADGPQDLVIHILAPDQRYETANYENLIIPTNLEVADATRDRFPAFYASLFDRTIKDHPRAVVTEYAWSSKSCDPCPTPPLGGSDLAMLGADVLPGGMGNGNFALTRLHARYTRDTLGEDSDLPAGARDRGRARDRVWQEPQGRAAEHVGEQLPGAVHHPPSLGRAGDVLHAGLRHLGRAAVGRRRAAEGRHARAGDPRRAARGSAGRGQRRSRGPREGAAARPGALRCGPQRRARAAIAVAPRGGGRGGDGLHGLVGAPGGREVRLAGARADPARRDAARGHLLPREPQPRA